MRTGNPRHRAHRAGVAVALACALVAGCKPAPPAAPAPAAIDVDAADSVTIELQLDRCPATLHITLPERFEEPTLDEGDGPNDACTANGSFPDGSFACRYDRKRPHAAFPLMRISVAATAVGGKRQGELDERTWNGHRERMLGVVQTDPRTFQDVRSPSGPADHDRDVIRDIRALEPAAPKDDAAVKARYPALFAYSANAAPAGLGKARAPHGEYAWLRRTFYAQSCAVNVEYFVALPSDDAVTQLARYAAATALR